MHLLNHSEEILKIQSWKQLKPTLRSLLDGCMPSSSLLPDAKSIPEYMS